MNPDNQQRLQQRGCRRCGQYDYHLFTCSHFKAAPRGFGPVPVLPTERTAEGEADTLEVLRCPECKHKPHGTVCFNIASDSQCDCKSGEVPAAELITAPIPDELCPHVELGEEMVGGFVFAAEFPKISVGMCALCLAMCQAEFITAEPFNLYRRIK